MIPPRFEYHAPKTVGEAVALLGQLGSDAKLLAGGHSLLPMMKLRFAQPEHLIDINRIPELKGIREEGATVVIGAMTVENDLIRSPILQAKVPLLCEAAKLIADPQVRNRGTIGGDIAHGDPGNDHPALSIAIDASFVLEGPNGRRTVAADGFFLGTYMTLLEENEVMCEIRVPAFAPGTGSSYEKLKRKTGDWATAGCAVVIRKSGDQVSHVRIALTNVAPTALRAEAAEAALLNKPFNAANVQAAVEAAIAICDPAEDLRGDIEYKTAMAGEMVKRAPEQSLVALRLKHKENNMSKKLVTVSVNGKKEEKAVEPRTLLIHFLREELNLTGAHIGCETSHCGACTVDIDGQSVKSCTHLAVQCDGSEVLTVEGLANKGVLHAVQEGFYKEHGLQCGFCTPGMLMRAYRFLQENPNPSEDEIRHGMAGNLCRCTGYQNIVKAVQYAAKKLQEPVAA